MSLCLECVLFEESKDFSVFKGALAQLGERNAGSVEVTGSIPVGSTNIHLQFRPVRAVHPVNWLKSRRVVALRVAFIELSRTSNSIRIADHFIPMRDPAGCSSNSENYCEKASWNSDCLQNNP